MVVRTYYWHNRTVTRPRLLWHRFRGRSPSLYFLIGNAGDIIARDILRLKYGLETHNVRGEGKRVLCVGSVAQQARPGDFLVGIGSKGEVPTRDQAPVRIFGLRGPITYEAFKKAGHDMSECGFLLDPGLLIRFMVPDLARKPEPGRVIFIPHYREREQYRRSLPKHVRFVDIDANPLDVAREILEANVVYSSSLHGIIFSHALGRPCVLVAPQTEEPTLKYQDYYASVNVPFQKPIASIQEALSQKAPDSPAHVPFTAEDFKFPDISLLRQGGLLEE